MGAPIIESHIQSVALYRHGAFVTRTLELPAGSLETLVVGPLPLALRDGSVRVAVLGDGETARATDIAITLAVPEPDEALSPARPEDLRVAQLAVRRLDAKLTRVRAERARAEQLSVIERPEGREGRPPPASPRKARLAILELRQRRLEALDAEARELERAKRDADRALRDLRDRERRASTARQADADEVRKRAEITLKGGGADARLELSYAIDAARWAPSYVLRLDPTMRTGQLELRASVAQRSGEDWDRVNLRLSTASMHAWAELPELRALRIGRRRAVEPKRGWRPPPVGTDALFADFDRAIPPEPEPPAMPEEEPMPTLAPAPIPQSIGMPHGAIAVAGSAGGPPGAVRSDLSEVEVKKKARRRERAAGAPAPAPSAAMPLQAAMAPMPTARRSSSLLGAVAGAVDGMFGGSDAPVMLAQEEAEADEDDSFGMGGYGQGSAQSDVGDPAALLDYGRLRMPGVRDARRGKLSLVSRRTIQLEYVEEQRLTLDLDAAFSRVSEGRRQLAQAPLPPGLSPLASSGHDYVYVADARLDAASDGAFHNLTISTHEVSAEPRFVVVPRESRDVFRYVEIDNPLDAPLLDGPIDVYVGEDFLLTSQLAEVAAGGTLRLGLGVEQRIKVARNTRFEEKTGGMLGGRLDLRHEVEVEIDNRLPREVPIEVRERLPVLREDEDDISLREISAEPPWSEWEPDDDASTSQQELRGGHAWRVRVASGEKTTLTARYVVRIASKNELVGGNRRER